MASYATSGYQFSSPASSLVNQGMTSLVDLGNKYKKNEAVGGLVAGSLADVAKTQANTGLAVQYNDAFLGSLARYQGITGEQETGNAMKLAAAGGAIDRDRIGKEGDELRKTQGDATDQALRLKADARNSIRQSARFWT
jgi:hypothetical protein